MQQFENLFSPFRIRNVELRNRVLITGHMTSFPSDGMPTDAQASYFAERAKGGVGLIVMAWCVVHKNGWVIRTAEAGFDDAIIPRYKTITDRVHEHGAKMFCQLGHPGRNGVSTYSKLALVSSTDIPCPVNLEMPKKAEPEDIEELIQAHADAAVRAREGGFDGVEIHSGYGGYLVAQFLSPYANRRDDEWGGSLENRMRLLREIIKRVRGAVGEDFVVGMQLAGDEYTPGGLTLDDTKVIAREIETRTSVDYLTVKAGTWYSVNNIVPDMQHKQGIYLPLASGIRGELKRVPVFAVGRIVTPAMAESVQDDVPETELCGARPGRALSVQQAWHPVLLQGRTPIPLMQPGDTVFWHPDVVHAVEKAHNGKGYSNVMYIGATAGCEKNSAYLDKQATAFLSGKTPPDFAPDNFEVDFRGRATEADLTPLGRSQMGLSAL